MTEQLWYRYEDKKYAAPLDEFDMPIGEGPLEVQLHRYVVEKQTPKGVWLRRQFGTFVSSDRRFVRLGATKRYACPTIEEAKVSFLARKTRQIQIHMSVVNRARKAIEMVNRDTRTVVQATGDPASTLVA